MTTKREIYEKLLEFERQVGKTEVDKAIKEYKKRATRAAVAWKTPTKRKAIPKNWVRAAAQRQNYLCARCINPISFEETEYKRQIVGDHIEAISIGGSHDSSNICAMHRACNAAKGSRTLQEDCKRTGQSYLERNLALNLEDTDDGV